MYRYTILVDERISSVGYPHMEMNSTSLPWWTEARPHMEALTTTREFLLTR
jgi:hypothetical protein